MPLKIIIENLLVTIIILKMINISISMPTSTNYMIGVDCGSSHSEAVLYQLIPDNLGNSIKKIDSCETERGISDYPSPMEAAKSIHECVHQILHEHKVSSTGTKLQILVGATAGMRLLEYVDRQKTESIFSTIQSDLSKFENVETKANIITGQEEALYAWTAVNYYNQNFMKQQSTSGVMEIGGASKQIAFSLDHSSQKGVEINLFGKEYNLMLDSDLCSGMNSAFFRYLYLEAKKSSSQEVATSCLPTGYTFTPEKIRLNDVCNNNGMGLKSQSINFVGSSNYVECVKMVQHLMNWNECIRMFDKVLCPHVMPTTKINGNMIVYLLSVYYHVADRFDLIDKDGHVKMNNFMEMNSHMCSIGIEEFFAKMNARGKKIDEVTQIKYCFVMTYVYLILTDGYNFKTEEDWTRLIFAKKVNGESVNWISGMILFKANSGSMKRSLDFLSLSQKTIYYLGLFFCLKILITCFLCFYFSKKVKKSKRKKMDKHKQNKKKRRRKVKVAKVLTSDSTSSCSSNY